MSSFPVYDILYNQCSHLTTDLTIDQKTEFCNNVTLMDQQGFDNMFVIIRLHTIKESDDSVNIFSIPYNGIEVPKETSKNVSSEITKESTDDLESGSLEPQEEEVDIKFNLDDLPVTLKQMLYKFTTIHIKQMKEDGLRKERE